MLEGARRYFNLYLQFIRMNWSIALSFRANLVLMHLFDLVFYISSCAAIWIIYGQVDSIGPWSRDQFLFFLAFILAVDGWHTVFLAENFWELGEQIIEGKLDYLLVRPVSPLFLMYFSRFRAGSLPTILWSSIMLIYMGQRVGLSWPAYLALPVLGCASLVLMFSFEVLVSLSIFWLQDGMGMQFIRIQCQNVARWPDFIFSPLARRLLTFALPLLLIGSAPVKFLLDFRETQGLFYMFGAMVGLWLFIALVWRAGMRRYESASS